MMTERENALMAINGGVPKWVPDWMTCSSMIYPMALNPGNRAEMGGLDYFGVEWEFVPSCGAPMVKPGTQKLTDITKWREQVVFPDLEQYDWEVAAEMDTAHVDRETRIPMLTDVNGIFERAHALMGYEDLLMAMMEEPEECYEFFGAIADHKIALHRKYAQYYKPEWITYHDDWGNTKSLFFSPQTFRELIKPHTKRIVDNLLELGIIPELHSHGKIELIMDDIVELGFKIVDPLEPVNDLLTIREKYAGKICLCFGADTQGVTDIPGATEEDIRADTRRAVDLARPGSAMVIGASIDQRVVGIFVDEANRYAKSFCK